MMKKPLFVTLANKNYLEYAKQVFAGAYFNAGWKGDYMLLAHDCTQKDTKWFEKKGIIVKHCRPIYQNQIADTPPVIISKLYLFTPEFKKWSHIIYLDADVIVRASLDRLLGVREFASVEDVFSSRLESEIVKKKKIISRGVSMPEFKNLMLSLKKKYNLKIHNFGAGMFVLNTHLIKNETFHEIKKIIDDYHKIAVNADQFALNLYFYKKWQKLPAVYDFYIYKDKNQWGLVSNKIQSIVIHFCTRKPWTTNNYFYKEWLSNYSRSDQIDLGKIPIGLVWSPAKIFFYSLYLMIREIICSINQVKYFLIKIYFKSVIFCEKKFPKSFLLLKRAKSFVKNLGVLEPSLVFHQSYNDELKNYLKYFKGKVLNAGAGSRDISVFIKGKVYNLDLMNNSRNKNIDIIASLEDIPMKDNFFDSIICNAALEHVPNPNKALSEMHRVLKNKGYLYLCCSFMQPGNKNPEDYWRFTKDGLAKIVINNNFKIIKLEGSHKYSQTIGWIIIEWVKTKNSFIYYPFRVFMKVLLSVMSKYSNTYIESTASGYRVLARKE